jgi:hypothetical protein
MSVDPATGRSPATWLAHLAVLAAPAACLAVLALRSDADVLAVGAGAEGLLAILLLRKVPAWHPPAAGPTILLYLIALGIAWFGTRAAPDAVAHAALGLFLVVAVGLTATNDLFRTGAGPRRRAAAIARRITARTRWPDPLTECAKLPEVIALKDAVRDDIGPVAARVQDPRPEVRAAAFCALAGRPVWRPNEATLMLAAAHATVEPAVRAVAAAAVAGVDDPDLLADVAGFLRDPAVDVRATVMTALLAEDGLRWPVVRDGVKAALSDPRLAADGPLPGSSGHLPLVALVDLTAWTNEGEPLAGRAVRTLIDHYGHVLQSDARFELGVDLGQQVLDPTLPVWLRAEVATLLRSHGLLGHDLLDRLTTVDQPAPLRLLAVEALLSADPRDADGVDVLRGLGRQPNREIAITIARILQTYLHFDFGLPEGPVAPNSALARDTARRVLAWASGKPFGGVPAPTGRVAGLATDLPGFDADALDLPFAGPQSAIN